MLHALPGLTYGHSFTHSHFVKNVDLVSPTCFLLGFSRYVQPEKAKHTVNSWEIIMDKHASLSSEH